MHKGYDNASFFYDRLAKLVFGNQLHLAQAHFLHLVPAGAKILIAGGGSGWILHALSNIHSSGLIITYVDASPKMVAMARDGYDGANLVDYIAEDILDVEIAGKYDVVITPFFFDNFKPDDARKVFHKLHTTLAQGGLWLYTDFTNKGNAAHKLLLKTMYLFFALLCGVKTTTLPDIETLFTQSNYALADKKYFIKGFVETKTWKRK